MFRKKIQAASGSFQHRRPTQPSPTFFARSIGFAHCAKHIVGASPPGNTMNTMNTGEEHLVIEKAMFLENAGVHGPHENCAEK